MIKKVTIAETRTGTSMSGLLLLLLALMQTACAQPGETQTSTSPPEAMPPSYRFDMPDASFSLPNRLKEISGLTVLDENHLAAVQDEDGKIYLIAMETGEVVDDFKFEKDGDYEGIEKVDDRLFVLKSNGNLYEVTDWSSGDPDTDKHNTPLSSKYDTEGLAYDAANQRLLIACKEYAGKGLDNHRALYAFDLATMTLGEAPAYTIPLSDFDALDTSEHPLNRRIRRLLGSTPSLSGFKPSALAIHPQTQDLYVLSSVRKVILVLAPDGTFTDLFVLPEALFAQPEGLAFLPNGDLFISNEAGGDKATLLRFNYQGDA